MVNKAVLIICQSVHHGNTMKVAKAIAEVLDAEIKKPSEVSVEEIARYDLIGFGSGIYNRKHHESLFNLLDKVAIQNAKKAFIFSTSTVRVKTLHKPIKEKLIGKGFDITGEFYCKGFMSHGFTKYLSGGLNKGRPNEADLKQAKDFAAKLKNSII